MYSKEDLDKLRALLPAYAKKYLDHSQKGEQKNQYICPFCGSGEGQNKTGAFTVYDDTNLFKCFSCDAQGDIFALIGQIEGLQDFREQAEKAAEFAGIVLDDTGTSTNTESQRSITKTTAPDQEWIKQTGESLKRWRQILLEEPEGQTGREYLKARGINKATAKRFDIGYNPETGNIILPYGNPSNYYAERGTGEKFYSKPKREQAGAEPLYNSAALFTGKPCFVCEGQFDALTIEQAGGGKCGAVALCGAGGVSKFLAEVKKLKEPPIFILSLDNDEQGKKYTEKIAAEMDAIGANFNYAAFSLSAKGKDPNEIFLCDTEQFSKDIDDNIEKASRAHQNDTQEQVKEKQPPAGPEADQQTPLNFEQIRGKNILALALDELKTGNGLKPIRTGFNNLDDALGGGLFQGLYIIGAVSSLGKTTFTLQLADQIATNGRPVLFFSLEMTAKELIFKSLSRLMYQLDKQTAKTALELMQTTPEEANTKAIEAAANSYNESIAGNIYFYNQRVNAKEIAQTAEEFAKQKGIAPVIFVDYLQILKPANEYSTDKQNTDTAVTELRKLAGKLKTPVFCISSLNRVSYNSPLSFTSFKESGAIEYSSDVLIGLQPTGMQEPEQANREKEKENGKIIIDFRSAEISDVEVVVLKNRNGKTGGKAAFEFIKRYNHFTEKQPPKPLKMI